VAKIAEAKQRGELFADLVPRICGRTVTKRDLD
jgi:hypothetical protein